MKLILKLERTVDFEQIRFIFSVLVDGEVLGWLILLLILGNSSVLLLRSQKLSACYVAGDTRIRIPRELDGVLLGGLDIQLIIVRLSLASSSKEVDLGRRYIWEGGSARIQVMDTDI